MTKARPNTGYSQDFTNIEDLAAPKALNETGVGDLRSLLPSRPPTPNPTPTAAAAAIPELAVATVGESTAGESTAGESVTPRQHAAPASPPEHAHIGVVRTVQSNMRIPVPMAELIRDVRSELEWSTGELITTAISDLYQAGELAELFSHNRQQPGRGGLFQTRASRLPTKHDDTTAHSIVSYRLTPDDFDTLDRIKDEVGARSRGQLIMVALREWVTRHKP